MQINLNSPVSILPNVGKIRAGQLSKIGINTIENLLYHFPHGYENRGDIKLVSSCEANIACAFVLTVCSPPQTATIKRHMMITSFYAFDDSGKILVTFFNQPYIKDVFKIGAVYRFWGKISLRGGKKELVCPQYESYDAYNRPSDIVPLYRLTKGITRKIISSMIDKALSFYLRDGICYIPDNLPVWLANEKGLPTRGFALKNIHFPNDYETLEEAKKRLVFEEFLIFSLGISASGKAGDDPNRRAYEMSIEKAPREKLESMIPFEFTNAQNRVINEIAADMTDKSRRPMTRLLSGDVGSGKTVCAAFAVYIACRNGRQSCLMAPTEILARQHYNDLKNMFEELNIKTALLTGSVKASEKKKIYAGIKNGEIDFLIGTHALLSEGVCFDRLALVITDEQHRFGLAQRMALTEKSGDKEFFPHVLVMSATPIPRTMALILYGDMSVSYLDELPPGRQRVDTFLVDERYRDRLNKFIRKQADSGGQVYIVCPAVENESGDENAEEEFARGYAYKGDQTEKITLIGDSQPMPVKAAVNYAEHLANNVFPDLRVGFMHGKMTPSDKDRVMGEFEKNQINILVSTTVIEVGVNIPNATLMIIENAERFGLSQLHQLRGRVGRGKKKSYCVLVSDTKNEHSLERLKVMKTTYDGYRIAEQDLAQRGPGDFLPAKDGSARQHGQIGFNIASLCTDMKILTDAFECAKKILEDDPELSKDENAELKKIMSEFFGDRIKA